MKRDNPYWEILKSTDEKVSVIHGLGQIAGIECNNATASIFLFFYRQRVYSEHNIILL